MNSEHRAFAGARGAAIIRELGVAPRGQGTSTEAVPCRDRAEISGETRGVKMILAIIQPTKLKAVRDAMLQIGVQRMTVCDAQGYGRQKGQTAVYRGVEYKTNLLRKVALEIAVNDDFVERTIETLTNVARTGPAGSIGDGKIFVLPMDEVYRIGDPAVGKEAIN